MWPFGETVTIHRRTGVTEDADGNDVAVMTPETLTGVTIGPGTTTDLTSGQTLVTDELHAIFVPAIDLKATDRLQVISGYNAGIYDIDGQPKQYRSPMTSTSVTDAKLIKVTG